jgi:hypothetical protein
MQACGEDCDETLRQKGCAQLEALQIQNSVFYYLLRQSLNVIACAGLRCNPEEMPASPCGMRLASPDADGHQPVQIEQKGLWDSQAQPFW